MEKICADSGTGRSSDAARQVEATPRYRASRCSTRMGGQDAGQNNYLDSRDVRRKAVCMAEMALDDVGNLALGSGDAIVHFTRVVTGEITRSSPGRAWIGINTESRGDTWTESNLHVSTLQVKAS